jgi:hypothetical protein
MSNHIGFLVVSQKTGYMLEGKDHAAKIFELEADAKSQCAPMSGKKAVPIDYDSAVRSLLKGAAFCFDSEEGYRKFLARVRNDTVNKPFTKFSTGPDFVRWRFTPEPGSHSPDGLRAAAAKAAPVATPPGQIPFNPHILVR